MKFTFAPESKPLEGYTIKRAIYRGGFGEVYYALTDAGREVALKLLQNNTEIELRGVQQCLNLSHPNLVTIFDIRQDGDGDHWIVMEFVPGETLDRAIRRFPSGMPMEEIRRWLPGIVAGVAHLHEHGLVHRDLKPANIFSDSGCVKVGDVGLSKFITPSRRSAQTQSVGTVYYMAPEVAKGRYGKEVDVYALGVILFEMLTGRVPFDGDSTGEILMKHLTERPDVSKLPPRLRAVVERALEKDPALRYASVSALASSFEDAVLGRGPSQSDERRERVGDARARPAAEHFDHASAEWGPSGNRWRRVPPAAQWRRPESAEGPQNLAATSLKWVLLALLFSWVGWTLLVPVAAVLAAVFGVMFVFRTFAWSAGRLSSLVLGGYRDARFAVSQVGWAAQKAVGAVAAAPRTAGNAMQAAAGCCVRPFRSSAAALPATTAVARWTHWTGTAAASTLVAGVFTLGLPIIWPKFVPPHVNVPIEPAQLGLFGMTAVLAAWAITAVCKFWDGTRLGLFQRLSLGLAGLGVGAMAWQLERFLLATPGDQSILFPTSRELGGYAHELGLPLGMVSTMVFFGALFFVRNWMRQSTVYRSSRFRLTSMAFTALVAAMIAGIMNSPVEVLMTWAAVLSATVQLASAQETVPAEPAALDIAA
ncbi:MAG: serine/threonine protein kinase [Planctomyces sp.]|nr:serine/threonine protein kinase [Planctomyces sp.]